jgi:hypothetical protein
LNNKLNSYDILKIKTDFEIYNSEFDSSSSDSFDEKMFNDAGLKVLDNLSDIFSSGSDDVKEAIIVIIARSQPFFQILIKSKHLILLY